MGDYMKMLLKLLRRLIGAFLLLYGVNLIISSLNIVIPINYITVGAITLLGSPALLGLVAIYLII
jgi:hypothetical protein